MYNIKKNNFENDQSPILIGGVGGSGTRVVAEILIKMGFHMGHDLNKSNDYINYRLAKTLKDMKQAHNPIKKNEIEQVIKERIQTIEKEIKENIPTDSSFYGWGWKVPGNFYNLEYTTLAFKNLKYIHLIRNGLDMAFSKNQNQLRNWGFYFGVDPTKYNKNSASLKYWISANKYAISKGKSLLNKRFHLIYFDDLVDNTSDTIFKLAKFLNVEIDDISDLTSLVSKPESVNRYKLKNLNVFERSDLQEFKDLGFKI